MERGGKVILDETGLELLLKPYDQKTSVTILKMLWLMLLTNNNKQAEIDLPCTDKESVLDSHSIVKYIFWGPGWSELPDHYSMLTAVSILTGGTNTLCIMR